MWFPRLPVFGLAAQLPWLSTRPPFVPNVHPMTSTRTKEFNFKAGADVFTPKDLIELARLGTGLANPDGDLVLVPVSKYSFEDKK